LLAWSKRRDLDNKKHDEKKLKASIEKERTLVDEGSHKLGLNNLRRIRESLG